MEFNTIGFSIVGIPPYFFCVVIGIIFALGVHIGLLVSKRYYSLEYLKLLVISGIGLILFARLFGCLSGVYRAIGTREPITFQTITHSGIVFYGGLFGFLGTYYVGIKTKLITDKDLRVMDLLAVSIPLFHAFARVGCFLVGCCYGIEYDCFLSVDYTILEGGGPCTAPRIPVQIIEMLFNFALFAYLFVLAQKENWKNKNLLLRYIVIYSCGRFLLEFIRGDTVRGIICGISFSQMISMTIWVVFIICQVKQTITKYKEKKA